MKPKYAALIFALSTGACVWDRANEYSPDDALIESEVETAFDQLVSAARAGDYKRYFSFFDTDTFTALNADGSTLRSFDAFKLTYEPQLGVVQSYKSLKFDPIYINVIDANNAILVNEFSAEVILTSGDVVFASGAGAQFWSRKSGEWKLVHVSDAQKH